MTTHDETVSGLLREVWQSLEARARVAMSLATAERRNWFNDNGARYTELVTEACRLDRLAARAMTVYIGACMDERVAVRGRD